MKLTKILLAAALCTVATSKATAQTEAEQKAWMEFMTPSAMHKLLAADDGTWNTTVTMWMAPGTEPTKGTGYCVNKMILGGRYQQSEYHGEFMGMPMEGLSTVAYDNATKKFISTWVDNFGTGIMTMEGTYDEKSKCINYSGSQTDPMTGKPMKVREAFTFVDASTQKMEMWADMEGKEFKTMEIIFKRK